MTFPLTPPADAVVIDLPGLEADNLLAFLALLGLLRSLEISRPDWRPRASWKGPPWVARLHLAEVAEKGAIAEAVEIGLRVAKRALAPHAFISSKSEKQSKKKGKKEVFETKGRKSFFSSTARARRVKRLGLRALLLAYAKRQGREESREKAARLRLDLFSCLAIENSRRDEMVDSPFKLPSGQQAFVGALYNSISRTLGPELSEDYDAIGKALFGEWLRKTQADSLRLSADEERRYALRYGDPTKASDKPTTELGANALAGLGLSSLFMAGRQNGWQQVGYSGSRASGQVTWPLFQTPGGVIVCIMALREIVAEHPKRSDLTPYGVSELFRARRFVLDPEKGDYGNISRARSLWGNCQSIEAPNLN
jgi:hypothetical protein